MKNILLIFCTILMVSCSTNSENKKTKADFLNDIKGTWTVSKIANITKEELTNHQKTPFITIEEEKVNGNNGCNNFFSSINTIEEKNIEFSMFGETKMMCAEMKIADAFGSLLSKIDTYSVDDKTLTFFNAEGQKILVFTK
ncbi:META domain-containing protein [Polaribacter aestuariivivens]|uniref:META domain-containing protein n=1 Tax=Polaribacter aestuariivivens TaxID=2304626 RepID=A0A5S3N6D1_9FLAO|nr:META domain-containing protein [Polaribacter aestuariivivens]TMM30412.1 META domain-containing protein [Polaribacter aestuariivivens]